MASSLFRNGEFRSFLLANVVERFAAAGMTVLLGFQVYDLTKNPLDLGWLGLIEAIPALTLVLYGGHIADWHSRRRIILSTVAMLTLMAVLVAVLSSFGGGGLLYTLFAVAFVSGSVRAFQSPAAAGVQAQVVPANEAVNGVALLATTGRVADICGPVVVGFTWAAIGPTGTYAAIAALFGLSLLPIWLGIAERPLQLQRVGENIGARRRIVEGLRYVFSDQILAGSMALDLFAVFFGGATALLPIFATDILHVGPVGFGFLRAASAAGALGAAMLASRFLPQHKAGRVLHWIIAGFGLSIIAFGLSENIFISLIALFLSGVCDGLSMVIRHSIMRLVSPEELRGRIAAVRMVFVGSSNELGALESGVAASAFGAAAATWLGGVVTLGVVAIVYWRAPQLRNLDLAALAKSGPKPASAAPTASTVAAQAG